jgi:meso-butanediol dehydrogenase / (S,S)-butanediol dehydrogenase / diacetyl reductase
MIGNVVKPLMAHHERLGGDILEGIMEFSGKVALVTGGGGGIGSGVALALGRAGAIVGIADLKAEPLKATCSAVEKTGAKCLVLPTDVADATQVESTIASIIATCGKLDILVNCAGIIYVVDCVDTTEEQWDRTIAVNAKGVFLCCRAAARHMIGRKQGKIVNIASMIGKTGVRRYTHYCASKFAVIGFTQALAMEMAPYGVNVNAVCPGIVDTGMLRYEIDVLSRMRGVDKKVIEQELLGQIPLGRYETPQDVAEMVLFLASTHSAYITGQSFNTTGGVEMH